MAMTLFLHMFLPNVDVFLQNDVDMFVLTEFMLKSIANVTGCMPYNS